MMSVLISEFQNSQLCKGGQEGIPRQRKKSPDHPLKKGGGNGCCAGDGRIRVVPLRGGQPGRRVTATLRAPQSSGGDNGMQVGMKPGVISEGVDYHDHPQNAAIEAQHGLKEHLQDLDISGKALSGASGRT